MDFRAFLELSEAVMQYEGPLPYILGDGESRNLHYGGTGQYEPFLFIPIHRNDRLAKKLMDIRNRMQRENKTIYCTKNEKKQGGFDCRWLQAWKPGEGEEWEPDPERDIGRENKLVVRDIGEMHITIALGKELQSVRSNLISKYNLPQDATMNDILMEAKLPFDGRPLFQDYGRGDSYGIRVYDLDLAGDTPIFGVASTYTIPSIGGGMSPIAVLMPIRCPLIGKIRNALDLPERSDDYVRHITIGYVAPAETSDPLTRTTIGRQKTIASVIQPPRGGGKRSRKREKKVQ